MARKPYVVGEKNEGQTPTLVDYSDSESEGSQLDSYSDFVQSPVFNERQDSPDPDPGGDERVQSGAGSGDPEAAPSRPVTDHFDLSRAWNVFVKKFNIHGKAFHVQFRNTDQIADLESVLLDIIRRALTDVYPPGDPSGLMGLTFKHVGLRQGRYLVPFLKRSELTPERIFEILMWLLGYDGVDLGNMEIVITTISETRGGRPGRTHWKVSELMAKHKQTFIKINNQADNLCFPRAVVVAKSAIIDEQEAKKGSKEAIRRWNSIRDGYRKGGTLQKREAQNLAKKAGLEDHNGPYGEPEFRKIQAVLEPDYQIKIFSSRASNCIVFEGKTESENVLNIFHYIEDEKNMVGHFAVLRKPNVLFNTQHWCDHCNRGFNTKKRHRCMLKCNCCYSLKKCPLTEWKHCDDCNRNFRSEKCFENHIAVSQPKGENKKQRINKSICQKFRRCMDCGIVINLDKAKKKVNENGEVEAVHHCGYVWCTNCDKEHEEGKHLCFMQRIKDKNSEAESEQKKNDDCEGDERAARVEELLGLCGDFDEDQEAFEEKDDKGTKVFFDFESFQTLVVGKNEYGDILEHVPNYCVVYKVCKYCQNDVLRGNPGHCTSGCGTGKWIFEGVNCRNDFCDWLFHERNEGATVIAHNSKGYDGQFLIQYLVKEGIAPNVITRGTEFMKIECQKIRVIDSLNFFPMGLAELPKAFNLTELKKGFFPHKFNRPENQSHVGTIPEPWYFDPDQMRAEKREEFFEWYRTQQALGKQYNFKEELAAYCQSDVDILMRSCLKFEKEVEDLTEIRPFDVAITIASFCMYLFRRNFLKEDTIGLIPHSGYRGKENQSIIGLQWLKWMSEQQDLYIQHAGNGHEKKIGKYKVDGFDAESNTVYEFNGCVWHGHTCKVDRKKKVPNTRKTMEDVYQDWLTRKSYLEAQGYGVVVKWECELRRELRNDLEMREYFNSVELRSPLDVNEALRGGRTNAIRLHHHCKEGERMDYVDVVSLYPWGVKWTEFPKGHPQVITENFKSISAAHNPYFGIIKCRVLAPKQLLHPVLPFKSGGKLMFPLCRSCAQTQQQGYCTHSDSDREFTGEFVSTELNKALKVGYMIRKVHEVWHYQETEKHDGVSEETGLFTKYINFFLKLKIEASGWPKWVKTDEDKETFIQECYDREGIELDPRKIEKNPGRRQVAKLCLNSFWGKFGQRSNMSKDEFIVDPSKFSDVVFDQNNVEENVRIINEEMVLVTYRKEEEYAELMPHMNKVVAAFTTANCRLRLYEELEKLGERVCYFDTDSVIYLTRPGDKYHPKLGSFLGDMTDELEGYGAGAYIEEFVSGGPKNYGYRVRKSNGETETKVKIRGFTLNYHAAEKLNFENLKMKVFDFVKKGERNVTEVVQPSICRTRDRQVVTKNVPKNYGVVYDKRWLLSDFCTLPYGTCEEQRN